MFHLINIRCSLSEDISTSSQIKIADIVMKGAVEDTQDLRLSGSDASLFQICGNQLVLRSGVKLDVDSRPALEVRVSAGEDCVEAVNVVIEITHTSQAPFLIAVENFPEVYVDNRSSVCLTDTVLALNPGSEQLSEASISITDGFEPGYDRLKLGCGIDTSMVTDNLSVEFDESTGTLTVSGAASVSDYLQILRSIEFSHISETPASNRRLVEFAVVGSGQTSNTVRREIRLTQVQDHPEVINFNPVEIGYGDEITIDPSALFSFDVGRLNKDIVYAITEPPAGVEILVDGLLAMSFSQSDINSGLVVFAHDGSANAGGTLYLEVDDGLGGIFGLSSEVAVARPENNTPERSYFGEGEDTVELLVSLKLARIPVEIDVFQQAPLVNDVAQIILERFDGSSESQELREEALAALLDINPLRVVLDPTEVSDWLDYNGGVEESFAILQKQFSQAADEVELNGIKAELVTESSAGMSAVFLVWLLRGGTLLRSLMSAHPISVDLSDWSSSMSEMTEIRPLGNTNNLHRPPG